MKRRSFIKNLLFSAMMPVAFALGIELISKPKMAEIESADNSTAMKIEISANENGEVLIYVDGKLSGIFNADEQPASKWGGIHDMK